MASADAGVDRVRRFESKVKSTMQYLEAAATSGQSLSMQLIETTSQLLDCMQHFLNAVMMTAASASEGSELRESVQAKRLQLCGHLAELVRWADNLVLAKAAASPSEARQFCRAVLLKMEELSKIVVPLGSKKVHDGTPPRGHPLPRRTLSDRYLIPPSNARSPSLNAGDLSAGLSKSVEVSSSFLSAGMHPSESMDSIRSAPAQPSSSQYGRRSTHAGGQSLSSTNATAYSTLRPRERYKVKREASSDMLITTDGRGNDLRERSASQSGSLTPTGAPEQSHLSYSPLSEKRLLSKSQPLLNCRNGAISNPDAQYQLSSPPPDQPFSQRSMSMLQPLSDVPPALPPKKNQKKPRAVSEYMGNNLSQPTTEGRTRVNSLSELSAYSVHPSVSPRQPSFSPAQPQMRLQREASLPEGFSGLPEAGSTVSMESLPGSGGRPPKPYHPTMLPPSQRSSVVDVDAPTYDSPPPKPFHPTLKKKAKQTSVPPTVTELQPPPKPPRPETLVVDPDHPPPIPLKKKALVNYFEQISRYQSPGDSDIDDIYAFAPRFWPASLSTPSPVTGPCTTTPQGMMAVRGGEVRPDFSRITASRTKSVFGADLNIPPPVPVKKRNSQSSVKRSESHRSTTSRQSEASERTITPDNQSSVRSDVQSMHEREDDITQPPIGSGISEDSGVHTGNSNENLSAEENMSSAGSEGDHEGTEEEADQVNLLDFSDVDYYLVFNKESDGHTLKGGPVDALIAHAASDQKHESDRLYYEAFLMTYRTFVEPHVLIEKLLERHHSFLGQNEVICHCTLSLLMRVVDDIKLNLEKTIMSRLLDTVFGLLCDNELKLAQLLHSRLFEKMKQKADVRQLAAQALLSNRGSPPSDWTIARFKSRQVAIQMTLIDSAFYQAVEVHECLTWSISQSEEQCPNLTSLTEHFNNVSNWVRSKLLEPDKKSDRERVILKWVKVMEHLRDLNNFSSLFAILGAMDCAAVNRLSWPKEVTKGLEEHRKLTDSCHSFKFYRDTLDAAGAPCIPYLGLFLQDLTFINTGNSNRLEEDKECVNFAKRWRQFNVLVRIRQYQQHGYDGVTDKEIIQYFQGFKDWLDEEELYQRSLQIKPRGTA